jgi:eukaryotic-like serine/threonine-protein kinase
MPPVWPSLLRSIVDGKYFLKEILGEEMDAGVFAAESPDGSRMEVRVAPADSGKLAPWQELVERSRALAHPNLLSYLEAGEARLDGNWYAYLVSEPVQERLDEVVASRTLNPDETRYVAECVMGAVDHLHKAGYSHGHLMPASIVAAGDAVKLLTPSLRPMPEDETEVRRAVAADLRDFAGTIVELLTGKREPGAGAQLPSPFREFVRASYGTEDCPSPTAAQLLGVLNGLPLTAPKPPVADAETKPAAAAPVTPVASPEPPRIPAPSSEPVRFKPGAVTVALVGVLVIALAFAAYRSIAGRSGDGAAPPRTPAPDVPAAEAARPSPVSPTLPIPRGTPPAAAAPTPAPGWAVVAAVYNSYDAAERRARSLSSRWDGGALQVYPERGKGSRYMVVVASGLTQREAERVREKARRSGLPRDSYVTRLGR